MNKEYLTQKLKEGLLQVDPMTDRIGERMLQMEPQANNQVEKYDQAFRSIVKKENLTLSALILFLLGIQLLPTLILLAILNTFGFLAGIFMALIAWILIFAIGFVALAYILIWKFQEKLKGSSLCYFFAIIISACEAILLFYIASFIGEELFLIAVSVIVSTMFINAVFASYIEENYNIHTGKALTTLNTLTVFILSVLFFENEMLIPLILTNIFVFPYQFWILYEVESHSEHLGDADKSKAGLYATLLIFKSKIELLFILVKLIKWAINSCKKQPKNE